VSWSIVRVQVHTTEELRRVLELPEELLDPSAVLLGINNRDLQTFKVSLDNTAAIMGSEAGQQVRALCTGISHAWCAVTACLRAYKHIVSLRWSSGMPLLPSSSAPVLNGDSTTHPP